MAQSQMDWCSWDCFLCFSSSCCKISLPLLCKCVSIEHIFGCMNNLAARGRQTYAFILPVYCATWGPFCVNPDIKNEPEACWAFMGTTQKRFLGETPHVIFLLNACYRICFWMRLCMFSTCAFYLLHNHRWQVQQAKLVAQRAPSALTPWAEVCYHCCSRVEIDERWPERRQMQVTWCLLHKEPKRVGNRKQFIKWIQSQGLVLPYYVHKGGGLATLGVGASLGRGGFQCRFVKKQDMCIWSSARLFA